MDLDWGLFLLTGEMVVAGVLGFFAGGIIFMRNRNRGRSRKTDK